jgi:LPXTG-motif cell wall-anchored protein
MTVSAGTGGGTVGGVILGGGAGGTGAAGVIGELPHTGAGNLMLLIAIALFLLVAGTFVTGMARRRHELGFAGDDGSSG